MDSGSCYGPEYANNSFEWSTSYFGKRKNNTKHSASDRSKAVRPIHICRQEPYPLARFPPLECLPLFVNRGQMEDRYDISMFRWATEIPKHCTAIVTCSYCPATTVFVAPVGRPDRRSCHSRVPSGAKPASIICSLSPPPEPVPPPCKPRRRSWRSATTEVAKTIQRTKTGKKKSNEMKSNEIT